MINSLYACIWEPNEITDSTQSTDASVACLDNCVDIQESTGHATFGTLWIDDQLQYQLVWKTSMHKDLIQLPLVLMQFICNCFGRNVQLCTEYVREEFISSFGFIHGINPSDLFLIGWMLYLNIKPTNQKRKHALVGWPLLCCTPRMKIAFNLWSNVAQNWTGRGSVLFQEWHWSQQYSVISPATIEGPCFVVSMKDDTSSKTKREQIIRLSPRCSLTTTNVYLLQR